MQGDYGKPSSYVQTGRWPQAAPLDKAVETPVGSYKVGLQFRHLYLLVAYWPDAHSRFLIRPWYFPLWPIPHMASLLYQGTLPDDARIVSFRQTCVSDRMRPECDVRHVEGPESLDD